MEELGLPGIWGLTPLAAVIGMLVLAYWLLATGRVITKSSHEREIGIYKEQLSNRDQTISSLTNQLDSMMSVGKTVQAVLRHAGPDIDENTEPVGGV